MKQEMIKRYALQPENWPRGEQLQIAIVSDPHVGWPLMGLERLRRIVDQVNALGADIIVMLGDYRARYFYRTTGISLDAVATELARLNAPLGVYGILGNHDWWDDKAAKARKDYPCETTEVFEAHGLRMLENACEIIDGRFNLVGLGDQWAFGRGPEFGVHDVDKAFANARADLPTILLAHEPDIFGEIDVPFALQLSGHTHGGQVAPFGWTPVVPSKFGAQFVYGHFERDGRELVVSGGLGYSGLPIRIGRPSEITVVELS